VRKLLVVGFMILTIITGATVAESVQILVDVSKDGGLWWSPQSPNTGFDPQRLHQGKAFADIMRDLGWEVVELPRGAFITADLLTRFDVIVKPQHFFEYAPEEIDAYEDAVSSGARLLLMGSAGASNPVAERFGIHFAGRNEIGEWVAGDASRSGTVEGLYVPLTQLPPNAVTLASIGLDEKAIPVFGYVPFLKGSVFCLGESLLQLRKHPARTIHVLSQLFEDAETLQTTFPEYVVPPVAAPPPELLLPVDGALLPQPNEGAWVFEWEETPDARAYQILVIGAKSLAPMVNTITSETRYVIPQRAGYIADRNGHEWSWRVRAQYKNGEWGQWTAPRTFGVLLRRDWPPS
jgi:hypothetical protein